MFYLVYEIWHITKALMGRETRPFSGHSVNCIMPTVICQEVLVKPKILFVCGKNKWRSPTTEKIYRNDQRIEVRSAGIRKGKTRQVSDNDLQWANLVLVMEYGYKSWILEKFRNLDLPPIENLDILDEYEFMNEELIDLIKTGTEYHINQYCGY